jgi:hypothetical protein
MCYKSLEKLSITPLINVWIISDCELAHFQFSFVSHSIDGVLDWTMNGIGNTLISPGLCLPSIINRARKLFFHNALKLTLGGNNVHKTCLSYDLLFTVDCNDRNYGSKAAGIIACLNESVDWTTA